MNKEETRKRLVNLRLYIKKTLEYVERDIRNAPRFNINKDKAKGKKEAYEDILRMISDSDSPEERLCLAIIECANCDCTDPPFAKLDEAIYGKDKFLCKKCQRGVIT